MQSASWAYPNVDDNMSSNVCDHQAYLADYRPICLMLPESADNAQLRLQTALTFRKLACAANGNIEPQVRIALGIKPPVGTFFALWTHSALSGIREKIWMRPDQG